MSELIETLQPSVCNSIRGLHRKAPGTIGDLMDFQVILEDREKGEYLFQCKTFEWMRNALGTLHGGMSAAVVDQAMGFVAYSYMRGPGVTPTIQLQMNYHRPLKPGEDVRIRVRVVSVTRTLVSMTCDASAASEPERICITATGTSYLKTLEK